MFIFFTVRRLLVPPSNHFLFLSDFLFWQEHLAGLEAEREELGLQIERLLQENQGLLQVKMSLGMEVSTYRYGTVFTPGYRVQSQSKHVLILH